MKRPSTRDEAAGDGPELSLEARVIPAKLTLPLRVKVQGIEAVLVSAAAYDAFSQSAQKSSRSRIERDGEVKAIVDARLSTHELAEIREEIAHCLGVDRAPSISALGRYVLARRRIAAAVAQPLPGIL